MLGAIDISCRLGGRLIVDGVTLDVSPGEVVAVIGPNGAGKSTLLSVLTGSRAPTDGQVFLDATELADWDTRRLARRRAVVQQQSGTQFPMTAYDVIQLGRLAYRRLSTAAEDRDVIVSAANAVGVYHLLRRSYPTLSGGESQRIQLARALAQLGKDAAGKTLFLDEPTSALDPAHVSSFLALMRELAHTKQIGVLCVLHDLNAVLASADRVVALREGKVVATGTATEVISPNVLPTIYGTGLRVIEDAHGGRAVIPGVQEGPGHMQRHSR